ncbi:MAG: stage III sporulation protein AF [Oscillospiraceae bacterium]|jgi:hypothetical protein|nr:stage III sporulation protein AF [Oscillospiraceae bacterium]
MDFIRSWALTLCLCSLGSALIYFLVPKGSMEKPMRTAISIFLLAAVISPLFKVQGLDLADLQLDEWMVSDNVSEQADAVQNAAEAQFQTIVADSLHKALQSAGYAARKIEVKTERNEQLQVSVSEITLFLDDANLLQKQAISELVHQETGITPKIEKGSTQR